MFRSGPSLLEVQHALHSTDPGYGLAQPGLAVFDPLRGALISPRDIGWEIDGEGITDFVVEHGGSPEHFVYPTIKVYGPDSPTATWGGHLVNGYVGKDYAVIDGRGGVRFPVIGLLYDPRNRSEADYNATLRHELAHLLRPEHTPPYYDRPLIHKLKAGSLAVSALATAVYGDMLNHSERVTQAFSNDANLAAACFAGLGGLAMASGSLGLGLVNDAYGTMYLFSGEERYANRFAKQHADFNPIHCLD